MPSNKPIKIKSKALADKVAPLIYKNLETTVAHNPQVQHAADIRSFRVFRVFNQ